jgi:subtilase family protein/fervidolysin-like protein
VEPDTTHTVSTTFTNLPAKDALNLLLGEISCAPIVENNSVTKLLVFHTSREQATQLIRPAERKPARASGRPIRNELLVTLKRGGKIDGLAKRLGAKVVGRSDELDAYRLQFEDAAAARDAQGDLSNADEVDSVDYNFPVVRPQTPEAWSGGAPSINLVPKAVGDSGRLVIGLIDTAVQPTGSSLDGLLLPSLSVAGEASIPENRPTHGTSMWETILRGISMAQGDGNATAVRILPVDVYGENSATTTYEVAKGIYTAINNGAMIVNLSLGSEGDNALLRRVIQSGHEQGVLFFAAAGNEPVTAPTYPAAYPEVVAVTAQDNRGNVASYANRGDFVDVGAPGSTLVSFKDRTWLVLGTSASTAYASGMAAAMAETSKKSLAKVEAAIRESLAVKPQ